MKVLVTGATGFIGSHVVNELLARGVTVVATSANETRAKQHNWYKSVQYIPFNLENVNGGENYYTFFGQPDALIHLAWEGLPNYKAPFHVENNLPRHFRFLENMVLNGCRDITVSGTCLEYGLREGCLVESMEVHPEIAYPLAKNRLRLQLEALQASYNFTLKWVRLFYMFGQGQSSNSILPQLQTALSNKEKVFNMSPGDQKRDYLPVEAVATYICDISQQNAVKGIINCCSGHPVTVKSFVEDYLAKTNQTIILNTGYYPYADIEPFAFWGDTKKLKQVKQ